MRALFSTLTVGRRVVGGKYVLWMGFGVVGSGSSNLITNEPTKRKEKRNEFEFNLLQ